MTSRPSRFAGATALAAAFAMAATPAAAVELPSPSAPAHAYAEVLSADTGEANQYRRYRRHRDRGVDAGDVIAGVVVVGALAALIGSANSRNRDRDRYEERRERVRYDDRRDRAYDSRGIESAVDMCVDQVEYRDNRVDSVDRADRNASGWNVSGTLSDGERWTCFIDNSGNVRSIDYGSSAYSQTPAASSGEQLSDAAYTRARASTRTAADEAYSYDTAPAADGPQPAYPGGPLPGEEGYDQDWQVDADLEQGEWEGDGRYNTAQAGDFEQGAR